MNIGFDEYGAFELDGGMMELRSLAVEHVAGGDGPDYLPDIRVPAPVGTNFCNVNTPCAPTGGLNPICGVNAPC